MSRRMIPLLALLLSACGPATAWLVDGQDCSLIRWDRGHGFCRAASPPPPPPFCTYALGGVDCWANPAAFASLPRSLADNPAPLPTSKISHAP